MKLSLFELSKTAAVLALSLATAQWSNADTIRLDEYVAIDGDLKGVKPLIAYRSRDNCLNWNYVPGSMVASGEFLHSADLATVKIGNTNQVVYLTSLELQVSPRVNAKDVDTLRESIFQRLSSSSDSNTAECAGKAKSKNDIALTPLLVQTHFKKTVEPELDGSVFYARLQPTYESRDSLAFRNPMNQSSLTYILDASSVNSAKRLRQLQTMSSQQPIQIGEMAYVIDGIVPSVNSKIIVDAKYEAEFVSEMKKVSCSTSNSSTSLGGFLPIPMAVGGLGVSQSSESCNFQLSTHMKSAKANKLISFDHGKSKFEVDGKPIMYVTCNEKGDCTSPIPLSDFVEQKLLTMYLTSNFTATIDTIVDQTFKVTIGRTGQVTSTAEFKAEYIRTYSGRIAVSVPVYASALEQRSFDFSWTKDPLFTCAAKKYATQRKTFKDSALSSAIPVADECLN